MFYLRTQDRGPKLVLVQTLLRLKGLDVKISGNWDKKTYKAIGEYRRSLNLPAWGAVDGEVFFHLIQGTKLKLIDSIDASAGRVRELAEEDLRKAGEEPLFNERIPGYGVTAAVNRALHHRVLEGAHPFRAHDATSRLWKARRRSHTTCRCASAASAVARLSFPSEWLGSSSTTATPS